jgi:hypothetical protein
LPLFAVSHAAGTWITLTQIASPTFPQIAQFKLRNSSFTMCRALNLTLVGDWAGGRCTQYLVVWVTQPEVNPLYTLYTLYILYIVPVLVPVLLHSYLTKGKFASYRFAIQLVAIPNPLSQVIIISPPSPFELGIPHPPDAEFSDAGPSEYYHSTLP